MSSVQSEIREAIPKLQKRAASITHQVEDRTRDLPTSALLAAAGLSAIASAVLAATTKQKAMANFVGLWAPSLLLLEIYSRLLKLEKKVET